ncbi:type II secretion system F family protein [Candidatus Roizmanbacteria bacterium]|nr:type II secretion system F family protein [Candidatus Roizmanbacteria bacterium]
MPIYRYKATDPKGTFVKGTITATSEKDAETVLLEKDLTVLAIKKERGSVTLGGGGFPVNEKISMCRYLALLINSGVSLSEGLELLAKSSNQKNVRRVLEDIANSTRRGTSLYTSFSKYRTFFGDVFLSMLKTGETSGTLSESFAYLSAQYAQEKDLKQKVVGALLYPIIIIGLMLVIGAIVFAFVLPRLAKVFANMDLEFPLYTRILFSFSLFLEKNLIAAAVVLVMLLIGSIWLLKSRAGKHVLYWLLVHMPVSKRLILEYNLVRFTQSLSALLKSGVPVTESVELSLHALSFVKSDELAESFNKKITRGVQLSTIFEQSNIFPPLMVQLVIIGERSGNLEKTLADIGEFYQQEVENSLKQFITLLEPILMIIVGIGVGAMVISIISPIYSLIGNLQAGM